MTNLLAGRRVLVVEDEMLVMMMIEGMLADLGCEFISSAASVDKALEIIEAQQFDVAMLDMNLSGANSYPVADALAARGIPYFFSTGYTAGRIDERYRDRPILGKPIRSEDLAAIFKVLLAA